MYFKTRMTTIVHDSSRLAGMHILLGSLLRIELMMRVGRIINHTFITWIPAAPHWLRGPRGIVIIPRWEMHSAHERALRFARYTMRARGNSRLSSITAAEAIAISEFMIHPAHLNDRRSVSAIAKNVTHHFSSPSYVDCTSRLILGKHIKFPIVFNVCRSFHINTIF